MSMISSLIDELNKSADEWNGSNMFELARMCREAADTITELRGALQVASVDYRHLQDENAKLREQIHWLKKGDILHVLTDQEFAEQQKHEREMQASIKALDDENAKLRELVARLIRHIENPPCESCMAEMSCAGGEGLTNCDEYQFMVCDARELGVEV